MSTVQLELEYTKIQETIFLNRTAKYVIASCGRRSGKTYGAAQYCVDLCLNTEIEHKILWCDVQYNQLLSYVDLYVMPILRRIPQSLWSWSVSRRELKILGSSISFRSSDRPDLLVGRGYSLAILNEAGLSLHENPTLWTQIILPMLLDYSDSRAFLIGTPRGIVGKDGKENIYFQMFKKGQGGDPKYQSFKYSTYENPKLKAEDIKELESEISPILRAQELYGEFVNQSELQIFNPEWWRICTELPAAPSVMKKFISIDSAFGTKSVNDESAATVWLKTFDGKFYCIDLWHGRVDYPTLVEKVKELMIKHSPDNLVIENKASGQSLVQTLRRDLDIHIVAFDVDTDKVTRASSITSYIESGNVFLLESYWNKDLINQATVFPLGNNDDIVDSVSQALLWAKMLDSKISVAISRKIVRTQSDNMRGY